MSKSYTCPGEEYPISRSVHLARLAAFYPKCRQCPHREDTGVVSPQVLERWQHDQRRTQRRSLWSDEGIRGVYLNELTRQRASEYVAALAAELWSQAPLIGRAADRPSSPRPRRQGPTVVVGRDERPSSPDIFVGVVQTLRRMSCQVLDVGLVSKACFCFAVDHLQAAAGVYVTGAGWPSTWTGCDFVGPGGQPLARGDSLDRLAHRLKQGCHRPTRSAGSYRPFQAQLPYEAALWKHFHDVRPVTVVCCTPSRTVQETLVRLFDKIPCRLVLVAARATSPARPAPRQDVATASRAVGTSGATTAGSSAGPTNDGQRLEPAERLAELARAPEVELAGRAVRQAKAELGLVVAEDGMQCVVLDEQGRPVPQANLVRLLTQVFLADAGAARVVLPTQQVATLRPEVESLGGVAVDGGETVESVWREAAGRQAHFALDPLARFWLREAVPFSDALLVLGRVLDALSASPTARLSELAGLEPEPRDNASGTDAGHDAAGRSESRSDPRSPQPPKPTSTEPTSDNTRHSFTPPTRRAPDDVFLARATPAAPLPRQ